MVVKKVKNEGQLNASFRPQRRNLFGNRFLGSHSTSLRAGSTSLGMTAS